MVEFLEITVEIREILNCQIPLCRFQSNDLRYYTSNNQIRWENCENPWQPRVTSSLS